MNLLKSIKNNRLIIVGITAFVLSYYPLLYSKTEVTNLIAVSGAGLLYVAVICFGEFVTRKYGGFSLLSRILRNKRQLAVYLITGLLGGLILDGTAQWLGRLWFYPFWSNEFYLLVFVIGFSAYYLAIIESYLAVKVLLDKIFVGRHFVTKPYKNEPRLFFYLFILSLILIPAGLIGLASEFILLANYRFNIQQLEVQNTNIVAVLLLFTGIWFFLEYISYHRYGNTLIRNLLHGNLTHLIAILLSALGLLIIMETQNAPIGLWVYYNWPWQFLQIFSIPLFAFLFWPLHYIGILSLYSAITGDQTKNIFAGDTFK